MPACCSLFLSTKTVLILIFSFNAKTPKHNPSSPLNSQLFTHKTQFTQVVTDNWGVTWRSKMLYSLHH